MRKKKVVDVRCINCKYYVKYKCYCKLKDIKTQRWKFCIDFTKEEK